jgi:hypothetical protein
MDKLALHGLTVENFDWAKVAHWDDVVNQGAVQKKTYLAVDGDEVTTSLIDNTTIAGVATKVGVIINKNYLPIRESGDFFLDLDEQTATFKGKSGDIYVGTRIVL